MSLLRRGERGRQVYTKEAACCCRAKDTDNITYEVETARSRARPRPNVVSLPELLPPLRTACKYSIVCMYHKTTGSTHNANFGNNVLGSENVPVPRNVGKNQEWRPFSHHRYPPKASCSALTPAPLPRRDTGKATSEYGEHFLCNTYKTLAVQHPQKEEQVSKSGLVLLMVPTAATYK